MLDGLEKRKRALALIKQGCEEVKKDAAKASLIKQGIMELETVSDGDLFSRLVCAIGYEKMADYVKAVANYDSCIDSLPESSLKYGIMGMKYRALSKGISESRDVYVALSMDCYEKAFEAETDATWKRRWAESRDEVRRI